jgi:PAS domain S-box-containing protein
MLGYTIEELKNKKWQDLTPSEDLESISKVINSLIQGEKNDARFNKRYIHKNGSYIWSDISVSLRRDQLGQPLHFITTVIDITQQKKAEEQLLKLSQAVEQSPTSIFLTDTSGNIDYANPKALETSGFEISEIIGKNISVFSLGEKPNSGYLGLWETISSGNEWRGEFHNKKKNGELYWESASVSPITNHNGDITHYLAIKEDITEHKQILDDLIVAKEKAEESNRLKTSFLQNMSHEIRTPMNGILGFAGLLKNPTLSGEKRDEFIDIVELNGQRLLTTINDIIEISKIEAGTVETNLKVESIEDIMQSHFNFFNSEIERMGLNLNITYLDEIKQEHIIVDRYKVDSIFINLINNAKKFTKQGGIEIGCYRDGNFIVFYVKDTGIGIAVEKHEAIFERFVQADQAITSGYEGSGLGLSISKAYVEMLGGEIWLESITNNGSTFYFSMPYMPMNDGLRAISRQIDEPTFHIDSSIQILIAEDDEVSYLFLDTLLSEYGMESIHAVDGGEAVETLSKNQNISLILMDLKMPGMDGFEATRQIRQFNKTIPIIAQTAYALSGTWNFTDKGGNADNLFIFHREVEKARERLAAAP